MATRVATRLEEFFTERAEGNLRSIIKYDLDDTEVVYVRDDVADHYTDEKVEQAVEDWVMESLMAPVYENIYAEDHGELTCLVKCFKNVIEMNFVVDDAVGAAVALDASAMADARGLVADARVIVLDE
ncbi:MULTISPECIES: hypothetical protein [unclassified Haladaptatus]|uniref:hypothetical protein n=1 Tax=unclassified Haladaptatus TaxID=2622732 RepID=UPI0023E8642D|nr:MULTISPECIES: hypothetical protein [unclassified Haladaptatus]